MIQKNKGRCNFFKNYIFRICILQVSGDRMQLYVSVLYLPGSSTIRKIAREVCKNLWQCLLPSYVPKTTEEEWRRTAEMFQQKTQFPNCLGSIDGKHFRVVKPNNSGLQFYNYKSFFQLFYWQLLMQTTALHSSTSGHMGVEVTPIYFNTQILDKDCIESCWTAAQLALAHGREMPFVFVTDEAFALSERVLRTYFRRNVNHTKRIFNEALQTRSC